LNAALAACLPGYDEVGLWLADKSKRPGSWVVMHHGRVVEPLRAVDQINQRVPRSGWDMLRCATSMLSPRLLLNANGITGTIEGIGSITLITRMRFEERVEIWKKCVTLEKGFWDIGISLSEVSRQYRRFSVGLYMTQEANSNNRR
jgi:hydroxymethylpyrimidine/phosphomethylpyrimidine kinase